jgi:hypothetical protein
MSPKLPRHGCHHVLALVLLGWAVTPALALDWREPWVQPHDATAAINRSDEYAWRLFVALNWPADADGNPDRSARLGAERPVVWESWASASSVYRQEGGDPGAWSATRLAQSDPARRFEALPGQRLNNLRHPVAGVMVPVADPIASAQRLTEIRFNRASFEFIRAQQLYDLEGQLRAYAAGRPLSFPPGATNVKAKWRPIEERQRARYFTVELTLADGSRRLYGLTALHIVSKDLPHWFWSTFEHVDNPALSDNEGWQVPSRDRFACGSASPDCNRAPKGIGLEGTVWQYYRLRGTQTGYTDSQGAPQRVANSELEPGIQASSSCMTCHFRSAISAQNDQPLRLPVFRSEGRAASSPQRQGFIGEPSSAWLRPLPRERYQQLDFVWSMTKAQPRSP